jgi:hypothetical protein
VYIWLVTRVIDSVVNENHSGTSQTESIHQQHSNKTIDFQTNGDKDYIKKTPG